MIHFLKEFKQCLLLLFWLEKQQQPLSLHRNPKKNSNQSISQNGKRVKEWKKSQHFGTQQSKMKNEIVNTDDYDDDDKMFFFRTKQAKKIDQSFNPQWNKKSFFWLIISSCFMKFRFLRSLPLSLSHWNIVF
mgnify:CR=1 FL=1